MLVYQRVVYRISQQTVSPSPFWLAKLSYSMRCVGELFHPSERTFTKANQRIPGLASSNPKHMTIKTMVFPAKLPLGHQPIESSVCGLFLSRLLLRSIRYSTVVVVVVVVVPLNLLIKT